MEEIKERINNYCNFLNIYILDEIISDFDDDEIIRTFKNKREEEINPHINDLKKIIKKVKITKKDIELIISIIKKIISIINNKSLIIDNDKIKRIKEEFTSESNYLISILNYGNKVKGLIITENKINKKKLQNDYKKFIIELRKFQSFIEKNKDKILNFIEKEEIKYDIDNKKTIQKEKTRILKIILKYNNKIEKEIEKLVELEEFNKKSIKILIKIRTILIDYPIRLFFKSIKITDLINKHNDNKYYKKTNEDLTNKYMKLNDNLIKIKNDIEEFLIKK